MKEYNFQKLMNTPAIVDEKIKDLLKKKLLFKQDIDKEEVKGHLLKAEHNLRFIAVISKEQFQDWALTGCYYSWYHAALALIQTKGYTSKNHLATLCIIIKEFYKKELSKEDIELLSNFLDYGDILFYIEAKNKRKMQLTPQKHLLTKGVLKS